MRVTLQVFDALCALGRPATCAELQRTCILDRYQVWDALRVLKRRGVLEIVQICSARTTLQAYTLTTGAARPIERRGRYVRDDEFRVAMRVRKAESFTSYSPAKPPSHASAPGAARMVIRGVLNCHQPAERSFEPHPLDLVWRKR